MGTRVMRALTIVLFLDAWLPPPGMTPTTSSNAVKELLDADLE